MRRYRHLFFDLDHTLWDFQANSRAVLAELWMERLAGTGIAADTFIAAYERVNAALWEQLDNGTMPKEVLRALRFKQALAHFGIQDGAMARWLEETYLDRCPQRATLVPGAMGLLEDLHPHYHLHVITNGFTEVQAVKLHSSGIRRFFKVVLTSEMAGASKPNARIFRHALRAAGARAEESLMIGDNARADIAGGRGAGMDQAHFVPAGGGDPAATHRIARLDELRTILL